MRLRIWTLLFLSATCLMGNAQIRKLSAQDSQSYMLLTQSISIQPKNADMYFQRGELLLDNQRYSQALKDYQMASSFGLKSSLVHERIGYTYTRMKMYSEAVQELTQAIDLDPHNFDAYTDRGFAFMQMNRGYMAIEDFKLYLSKYPDDAKAQFSLGRSYENENQNKEAVEQYLKASINDPGNAEPINRAGLCAAKMNDFESSVKYFTEAIMRDNNRADLFFNRGIAKGRAKQDFCDDFYQAQKLGDAKAGEMLARFCKPADKP